MKLSQLIPTALGFIALASACWAGYSHFQTDEEAIFARLAIVEMHASDRISDRQARKNDRIDRLERENARYERDLLGEMPDKERQFIHRQLDKNNKKIDCIRNDKC